MYICATSKCVQNMIKKAIETPKKLSFIEFKKEVLNDFKIALVSRECSIIGRREVLTGKAKFGIFGAGKEVPQWVFANTRGGMLRHNGLRDALLSCLNKAGLRNIRIHDLRHTYATIRLLSGHNIGDVSYQLGHSSIKITYDTYGHWLPGKFKSEVDELDNLHPSALYTHTQTTPQQYS